jgi:phage host-nuclease inhibitor protein Gam
MLGSLQIVMDIETAEAVETLRADIHQVEREVVRVETSLTAKIEHVETSLTAKIEHVETSLTAKIEHVETSLTAKMHELNEDAKRHSDVQFESVRDDIRILAEGFATLSARIDSRR